MDFLDTFFGNPDQTQALGLLGAHMMAGNTAGGFQAAQGLLAEAPKRRLQQQLIEAQIEENKAQARERAIKAQRDEEAIAAAKRKQAALPGLFGGQTVGGELTAPQVGGIPMVSQGAGLTPQRQVGAGQFNVMAAIEAGYTPKEIMDYAGLRNANMDEVARTIEGMDSQRRPVTIQYDKFGRPVGAPVEQWKAPVFQNLGGRTAAIDPVSLGERGSFAQSMSPEGRDASARGWAGHNLAQKRFAMEQGNAVADAGGPNQIALVRQYGKPGAGYRWKPDGTQEYIPGGPADPNAAKKAAPTEFQGKSATYGSRAQAADKIINDLEGKYSPMAVNSKLALGGTPLIGGALESVANAALSSSGQKAEQAQRDFVNAVLRQESGAAISAGEFENARKQYFPQPFDSPAVKLQKAQNRALAIRGFMNNARTTPQPAAGGATGSFDDNDPLGLRK